MLDPHPALNPSGNAYPDQAWVLPKPRLYSSEKIISEIERANNKDKILSDNDRKVISRFILKIQEELDLEKK